MLKHFSQLVAPLRSLRQQNRGTPAVLTIAVVLLTLLLILIFKFSQSEPPVKQEQEKAWVVQTQQLVSGAKSPQLELYGRVESPYAPSLTSSINADVKSLDVKEGEYVSQGQRLVSLDDTDVRLVLEERVSNIAELEAMITSENNRYQNDLAALKLEESLGALAEKKLAREEKTSKTNLTSQSSFDSQKQALQNQKLALKARQLNVADHPARLAQLEARLSRSRILKQQADIDLQRATVTAPFDGIILKTMVSPGERVRPGEVLLQMYATDQVELRAQLPQKYIAIVKQSLADGRALKATVKTESGPLTVTLNRVSGSITNSGIGVDALFLTESDQAQNLTIGDNLEMTLLLPAIENVFSVPVSSLYGTSRIYRVVNERLTAVTVKKLGNQFREGKQFILVRSEVLKAGDQIITTQLPHAVTGLKVEVRNASLADNNLSLQETSPQHSSRLR
jgi:multidrug efflux pump subunit AcrA (membrane-fusion protein)